MPSGATAVLLACDGTHLPVPPDAGRALGELLADREVRSWLGQRGLAWTIEDGVLRTSVDGLRRVLGALPSDPAEIPEPVRLHPVVRPFLTEEPRRLLATLAGMAGGEGGAAASDVVVVLPKVETTPALRLVPGPEDPWRVLRRMETVAPSEAEALLRALDDTIGELDLPHAVLERSLVPLLADDRTCGLASRILGKAGVDGAAPALERVLSRTGSQANRLEVLGALIRLGHRALGLRTLRTMLVHGTADVRQSAVRMLHEVAIPDDARAVHDMMRLAPKDERLPLASLLYRLGDLRAYAVIARGLGELGPESPAEAVTSSLDAVFATGSQRFVPLLAAYESRESRPWFVARARLVRRDLERTGEREPPPSRILEMAEHAWFQNRRDEALEHLDDLLVLEPAHAHGLYLKANCLKEEGRTEEALRASGLALASDPTNWRLHRLRGSLLWDDGRHEASLEAYDRALGYHPIDPYTWYYKGYVLYRLQRFEEALPCLDRALSLKGDSPYIYNQKAFCLERLGRHEEATRCYRRSLRIAPGDVFTREYLGQALQAAGKLEEALACFDHVLRIEPRREDALYRRADVLYDLERWEESAGAFAEYLAIRADSYNAWFNRGLCLRFLGRYGEAAAAFRRAREIRPDSENARRHLEYCESR